MWTHGSKRGDHRSREERKSRSSCRCFHSSSSKLRHFGKHYPRLSLSYETPRLQESESHKRTKIGKLLISDSVLFPFVHSTALLHTGGREGGEAPPGRLYSAVGITNIQHPLPSPGEGKRASENLWVNSTWVRACGRPGWRHDPRCDHRSWFMGLDVHHRTSKIAASREGEEWNDGLKLCNKGHVLLFAIHS